MKNKQLKAFSFFLLVTFSSVVAQLNIEYYRFETSDFENLDRKIGEMYMMGNCNGDKEIQILHVPTYTYKGPKTPEVFINKTFLNYLKPLYVKYKREKFPQTLQSIIFSKEGEFIATSNACQVFCLAGMPNPKPYENLLKIITEYDIKNILWINGTSISTYILRSTTNEFYVIEGFIEYQITNLKEYIENNQDSILELWQ